MVLHPDRSELRQLLDEVARRIDSPEFIKDDPVQFPRRFTELCDIEIVALLSSTIAWGNRKMICRNCEKMLEWMDYRPFRFVMEKGYEELPAQMNVHRTFFVRDFAHYLRGLRLIYSRHGSLADYARCCRLATSDAPAWELAGAINQALAEANDGAKNPRCLPQNLDTTALKRLNMALRWLVRDDGIVDMGVWRGVLSSAQLFIPLDVHVGRTARDLGLLTRRADDRRAAVELTEALRTFRPDDPVYYDYALFGLGIESKSH